MNIVLSLPTYTHKKRRHLKFGEETHTFSVKLPKETIEKIRERKLDMGQIVYDIVEQNLNPYEKNLSLSDDIGLGMLSKLVNLMIDRNITAPKGFFTTAEEMVLSKVATEEGL